jgi:hypothetical protein
MDGQQRISAIKAFYSNELILEKLDRWPELNGRTYSKLPERIRAGIDRRSISWITVLHESAETDEEALVLKQLVFERLNTGGVKLSHQEIRNSLFQGPFNHLLGELSQNPKYRKALRLPAFSPQELKTTPDELADSRFYLEMEDIELVLRFFALRNVEHYQRGMQGFLDLYMLRARSFNQVDLDFLRKVFSETMDLADGVYGDKLFMAYNARTAKWGTRHQKAYADAVLVAISQVVHIGPKLLARREEVITATQALFEKDSQGVLTGRGNTKKDVQSRIQTVREMLEEVASR